MIKPTKFNLFCSKNEFGEIQNRIPQDLLYPAISKYTKLEWLTEPVQHLKYDNIQFYPETVIKLYRQLNDKSMCGVAVQFRSATPDVFLLLENAFSSFTNGTEKIQQVDITEKTENNITIQYWWDSSEQRNINMITEFLTQQVQAMNSLLNKFNMDVDTHFIDMLAAAQEWVNE